MKKFLFSVAGFCLCLCLYLCLFVPLGKTSTVLTTPAWASAQCEDTPLLNAVALNAGPTALTFYVGPNLPTCRGVRGKPVLSYNQMVIVGDFDYTATAGTITFTCTGGPTRATATAYLTTCTVASGTCTLNWSGVSVTPSMSADTSWAVLMGTMNFPVIKCVASHSGAPGATDTLSASVWLFAKN